MISIPVAAFLIAMSAALSGCYMSEKDLIGEAAAIAPFERITYGEAGSARKMVLTRQDRHYVITGENGESGTVRFLEVGPNLYIVGAGATARNGREAFLYALLKVDPAAGTASGYKALARDGDKLPKGIERCSFEEKGKKKDVCVRDLKAYVEYAKAAMILGAKPDTVWQYTAE